MAKYDVPVCDGRGRNGRQTLPGSRESCRNNVCVKRLEHLLTGVKRGPLEYERREYEKESLMSSSCSWDSRSLVNVAYRLLIIVDWGVVCEG